MKRAKRLLLTYLHTYLQTYLHTYLHIDQSHRISIS